MWQEQDDFTAGAMAVVAIAMILFVGFIIGIFTTRAFIKIPAQPEPTWQAVCMGKGGVPVETKGMLYTQQDCMWPDKSKILLQ